MTRKKIKEEKRQRNVEEAIKLANQLKMDRREGALFFHKDNPSRGEYSPTQTHDTKFFDKLYFGNNPPNPIYEDDSDDISNWEYSEDAFFVPAQNELDAVADYQNIGYEDINKLLRGKKVTDFRGDEIDTKPISSKVKLLDNIMRKLPELPEDIIVNRRVWAMGGGSDTHFPSSFLENLSVGDEFVDGGFSSTGTDSRLPDRYGNVSMSIKVPKGNKALYLNSLKSFSNENQFDIGYQAEKEILLPRGAKFKVTGITPIGGDYPGGKPHSYDIEVELVSVGNKLNENNIKDNLMIEDKKKVNHDNKFTWKPSDIVFTKKIKKKSKVEIPKLGNLIKK